jgi:hypothetical protein
VKATALVRKMRGGTQPHLVQTDDGEYYVVKFRNNPQHRRVLINEFIAASLCEYLQLSIPGMAPIDIDAEFLSGNPNVNIQLRSTRICPPTGKHFGSRFPGDPAETVVYDFLPDCVLSRIHNLTEFAGALAFDKWVGNQDARQCIFIPAPLSATDQPPQFQALWIDNGYAFGGPSWTFSDTPRSGPYFRCIVYQDLRGWTDFEPWLERIREFPEQLLEEIVSALPDEWIAGDRDALRLLMDKLLRRRRRVSELIQASIAEVPSLFPNWQGSHTLDVSPH